MMLKRLIPLFLLTLTLGVVSAGEMILLEEAAEFETLSVRVSGKGHGNFRIKNCDQCEEVRLKIAPTTTLTVNGETLPLTALNKRTLEHGTVFYRAETGLVTRIKATR